MTEHPRIVILEHDPAHPPRLLADWLSGAGAELDIRRLHAGDRLPDGPEEMHGLVSMGGRCGAADDEHAPWLAETRTLLAALVRAGTPTLGIGLGAQLLALSTGGRVARGDRGPEIGAYLGAKRDVAEQDLLFGEVPISPDIMQFHDDVVTALPPGAVLMLSSLDYPVQAFRVGSAAWGMQFHIETTAAALRGWRGDAPSDAVAEEDFARSERRCGEMLDEAEQMMAEVWSAFVRRFVDAARDGVAQTPLGWAGPRLPLVGN